MLQSILEDRFDCTAVIVIFALLAAIGLVIVHGDQIGIGVQSYGPTTQGSSRATIRVLFDEPLEPKSLTSRFSIAPAVQGSLSVSQNQLVFRPAQAFQPGQDYRVTVNAGIQASTGRVLKQDLHWQFHVTSPRIVYLGPADKNLRNLYSIDPSSGVTRQITSSQEGVLDFDVAPDGSSIAYSELQPQGTANLMLWDTATETSRLLYECLHAACSSPIWRPDGSAIAFQRIDLNPVGTGPGAYRVWILDMITGTAQPLFKDTQQLGYMPRWSPDGLKLAVFNTNMGGISIHDFKTGQDAVIQSDQGELGQFSPDGKWIYFPRVVSVGNDQSVVHLVLVDLASGLNVQHDLVPDNDLSDDVEAVWLPDSKSLIVARRLDPSGNSGPQLYQIEVESGKTTPLIVDPEYSQSNLRLSPLGDVLLMQRFAQNQSGARPELWSYNLNTHELKRIVENAGVPGWMP